MDEIIKEFYKQMIEKGLEDKQAEILSEKEAAKAVIDAFNYKYVKKNNRCDFRYRIKNSSFIGTDKEKKIVIDISEAMTMFGLIEGEELYSYIVDCINIEKNVHIWVNDKTKYEKTVRKKTKEPDADNIYYFILSEICRIEKNKIRDFGACFYGRKNTYTS